MIEVDKNNSKVRKKSFIKEYGIAYLMLAPSLIMFIAFCLYPLCWVIINMFFDTDGVTYRIFTGLDNFKLMLTDKLWWNSVGNTIEMAIKLLIFQIPVSIILAVFLDDNIKGKGLFRFIYYLPAILPGAVMSLIFALIFSPYNGIINSLTNMLGIGEIDWVGNATAAMWSCVIITLWKTVGGNMLYFLSGLQGIPKDVYESASLDGASKFKQFFYITIPMLTPITKVVLMLSIISSLQLMETIQVFTAGGPNHATETMPMYIYTMFFADKSLPRFGYGSALGVVGSVIVGIITIFYNMASKKMDDVL